MHEIDKKMQSERKRIKDRDTERGIERIGKE
jgi:hypothetical protein